MITRCFCDNTTAAGHREASQVPQCYHNKAYAFTVLVNISLTFYTHPVLGGCLNNSTIHRHFTRPPLRAREGLACETTSGDGLLIQCCDVSPLLSWHSRMRKDSTPVSLPARLVVCGERILFRITKSPY